MHICSYIFDATLSHSCTLFKICEPKSQHNTPCAMAHLIFSLNIQIWINILFINMFPSGSIKVQSSWVDYEGDDEVNVGTTEPSTGRIGSA